MRAGARVVVPYLRRRGVSKLEALVLTHPDLDHIGGAASVMNELDVGYVLEPARATGRDAYVDVLEIAVDRGISWLEARRGFVVDLDGIEVVVLHPSGPTGPGGDDSNAQSVVVLVCYGEFEALLTGDAPVEVEDELLADLPTALEVLKVGHHGSITSTSQGLLAHAAPALAVISVGANNRYGHPHSECRRSAPGGRGADLPDGPQRACPRAGTQEWSLRGRGGVVIANRCILAGDIEESLTEVLAQLCLAQFGDVKPVSTREVMSENSVVTLERHIVEEERKHAEVSGTFSNILHALILAAKIISREVNKAGIVDVLGATGDTNVQGERVQKLDVYAEDVIYRAMDHTGTLCCMVSEESPDILPIPEQFPKGKYVLIFDPLDGSSNIDVNVSIGTIFSIHKKISDGEDGTLEDCPPGGVPPTRRRVRALRLVHDAGVHQRTGCARLHA